MQSLFEKPEPVRKEDYTGYFLSRNPFILDEDLVNIDGDDEGTHFIKLVCAKEIARGWQLIEEEAFKDSPRNLWLIRDKSVANMYNFAVEGGVFRKLVISENPRFLPVYVPLSEVFSGLLKGLHRLIVDRFLPDYLRNCVHAFAYQELKILAERGEDKQVLPELDVPQFLKEMDETKGEALDDILFPKKPEEVEDTLPVTEASASEPDEAEAEKTEETKTGEQEGVAADPRRDALIKFIETKSQEKDYSFGAAVQEAIFVSLRDGFEKGRARLEIPTGYRESTPGLVRLITRFYHKVVINIDQFESWEFFSEADKASFLGALTEFNFLSGGKIILLFTSDPLVFDTFDESFRRGFQGVPLDLSLIASDISLLNTPEQTERVLRNFLQADPVHDNKELEPFTADGVAELISRSDGNILKGLELASSLIEKGSSQRFPSIDREFVSKSIS